MISSNVRDSQRDIRKCRAKHIYLPICGLEIENDSLLDRTVIRMKTWRAAIDIPTRQSFKGSRTAKIVLTMPSPSAGYELEWQSIGSIW